MLAVCLCSDVLWTASGFCGNLLKNLSVNSNNNNHRKVFSEGILGGYPRRVSSEGILGGYPLRVSSEGILGGYPRKVSSEGIIGGYLRRVSSEGILGGYPQRVSSEGILGGYPRKVSLEGIIGGYPRRVSSEGILGRYPRRVSSEGILGRYPRRVSSEGILGEYPRRVSSEGILGGYPQRVSSEGILRGYHRRVSSEGILGRYPRRVSPEGILGGYPRRGQEMFIANIRRAMSLSSCEVSETHKNRHDGRIHHGHMTGHYMVCVMTLVWPVTTPLLSVFTLDVFLSSYPPTTSLIDRLGRKATVDRLSHILDRRLMIATISNRPENRRMAQIKELIICRSAIKLICSF